MTEHKLKAALQTLGHTRALKDGAVKPRGYTLEFEEVPAIIQAFVLRSFSSSSPPRNKL